ncbi:helix-turn-helix transcriptional regulator [Flammeovirga kamogawensis]|uniref:YafY family transcriptional regulator n=1 Tax=Flammeovirga kamogawensis TaxID=373891 RepID=A0ABX8GVC5_9BACT|nr:YafY family protein [Flammeovirga kamogawensis]MBB6460066.1 putative DNA-binding transcriptional regulator YafY [Flammeovirga kamogawensis]QWG06890.1 YafY family transcriptional regulator [Flammeovirga kamogawensis]
MEEKEKPRISRLTAILTQLQSKRIITAKHLAEKHNVSLRTIYRDIRTLEKSGVPIVTEEGKGYSIMEGYHLPPVVFTEDEANALITLEQLAIKNKDLSFVENASSAIEKIKAILRYSQKGNADLLSDRIYFSGNNNQEKTSNNLMQIQSAITQYNVLTIDYHSSENNHTVRDIEPFALYSIHGNFLLIGFCRLRNDFRHFRIDFIKNIISKADTFRPHNMTIKAYFEKYVKNQ